MSILSNLIFTVTSLNDPSTTFFTSILFLILSNSNVPTSISLASTLNLLLEFSRGTLDSPPLLNYSSVQKFSLFFPYTLVFSLLLSFLSASCSYSVRPCVQILYRYNSSSLYLLPLHRDPFLVPPFPAPYPLITTIFILSIPFIGAGSVVTC